MPTQTGEGVINLAKKKKNAQMFHCTYITVRRYYS